MSWKAAVLVLAVLAAGCSESTDEPTVSTTAPPDAAVAEAEDDAARARAEEARVAAIAEWASRPIADVLAEGFDTSACVRGLSPDDVDDEPATVTDLGWAFLSLPLEVVEFETSTGELRPAVVLGGDEVFPGPEIDYDPTHAFILDDDVAMLEQLDGAAQGDAVVVLALGPTPQGRAGNDPERLAQASFAWILTDEVIPFSGECFWVTTFKTEVGDPVAGLAELRTDPYRRAELAGLTDDQLDFGDCRNEEISLSKRIGFGGEEVGLAFGPWPPDADAFSDISLDGWTVIPPVGEERPDFLVRGNEGFPRGAGLDPDGWLVTFTMIDGQAEANALFSTDAELGLRIWAPGEFGNTEDPCFAARQVIAFREFIDGEIPDRPAWDLSPALPGGEQAVIDTLRRVTNDAAVLDAFREWTPCTHKLCELNGEVVR